MLESVMSVMVALSAGAAAAAPQWGGTVGTPGVDGQVMAMCVWDDGRGSALYVGGEFTMAGGAPAAHLARWDGKAWSAVGGGVDGPVHALHVFDDGRGKALYVGGNFASAGGVSAGSLARWDGEAFEEVGGGVSDGGTSTSFSAPVAALCTWDEDGAGPLPAGLIVGGNFKAAGGGPAQNLARWRGGTWTEIGGGIQHVVDALIVHDDGAGRALYVGGSVLWLGGFGAQVAGYIGRWDGTSWSNMLHGLNAQPMSFVKRPFDSRLYMAGGFDRAIQGPQSRGTMAWTGSGWEAVVAGVTSTAAVIEVFDARDGNGADLYVGGGFTLRRRAGGVWESIGGFVGAPWAVTELCVFDDGSGAGPALYVGGKFNGPGNNIAALLGGPVCPGDANGDLVVNFADLNAVLSVFGQSGVGIGGDVNGDGVVNFGDLNVVLSAFGSAC
ncbi:MAG: hypothetical protein AB7G17_06375 [Phycisphaerales bacterium]